MKELLLVIMLFFCKAIEGSDDGMNEDCIVKNKHVQYLHTRNKITWIAFLTNDVDLTMYAVYEGKDHVSDREKIHFQLNRVYRIKRRNREFMDTEEILGNISWPLGWTTFTAEVENTVMSITVNSYPLIIDFEFPVQYLSIISENLASCSRGKPKWKIRKDITSTIPLGGLENIHFSISSIKSFSPILHIKEVTFNLQYYSGVKIDHGNSPFPVGTYDFLIKKENDKLILHFKKEETGYDIIFEMDLADDLMDMKLSSLDESYLLELTPKNFENFENFGDIITTSIPTSNPTCPGCNGDIPFIFILIIFAAGMFIGGVIFYIAMKYIAKAKKTMYREVDNKAEYGRSSRTDLNKLEKPCVKDGNNSRLRTYSEQLQNEALISENDQNNCISALEACEEVHDEVIIIKQIKMSQDKEHVEQNFQVCYFNEMIPKINKKTKVILLVGDPDVGKTTLINAMVNHIFGADREFEIGERLKIVCDSDHDHKTAKLSAYCFPYQQPMIYKSHFVFIRTHNLSNTSDCEHKTIVKIKAFLDKNNGVNELHAICFVVNSDNGHVDSLRNAYDSIFSLFGYDIKNNIFVLTTFDKLNDETPKAVKALDKIQKYYSTVFRFNLDPGFLNLERIRKLSFRNMAQLFKRIDDISPCSLKLTNVMIEERMILRESVEDLREKITTGVDKMSELQKRESEAPDPRALKEIHVELKHMEEKVITKINEAKRTNERLNELTLPTVPHTINDFIDKLIECENKFQKENYYDRIRTFQKMKDRNVYTEDILQAKSLGGHTSIFQSFMTPRKKKD